MHHLSNRQHEQIEQLAYKLWKERGEPVGSPDEDWLRAEELTQILASPSRLPFSSLIMVPAE